MVVENKRVMIALVPGPGILFFSSWESIIQDRNTFIKNYKFTNKASELQLIGKSRLGSNSLDAIITGSCVICQYIDPFHHSNISVKTCAPAWRIVY